MALSSTIEVPAFENPLQYTARYIFEEFSALAPDFSDVFVFLPHAQVTQPFNLILCRATGPDMPAIIPPWAGTLKTWTKQFSRKQHSDRPVISEYSRQLLFIEALQQYPDLFRKENQWQVTQALLGLFDELSLNQKNIFTSADDWQQQLNQAYGIAEQDQSRFDHLLYEGKLVYTLWHAWQQQLDENGLYDETGELLSRLHNAASTINEKHHFICLGTENYSSTERDFIDFLVASNQCQIIDYESTLGDKKQQPVFARFISETFKQAGTDETIESIKQRALNFAAKYPDFSTEKLPFSVFLASSEERQIRAIDYYIRLNILNGKNNIAVISEDRKLSRRLRALLERANIQLQDNAGWSLATTQAASIIERWLECIEEDFSAYPFLDCMKSPYINITHAVLGEDACLEDFRKNIYRFEHDLVFHENISSNIGQYKSGLRARLKRLSHWPANSFDELINTLDFFQGTAKRLSELYTASSTGNKKILLSDFVDALTDSLNQLGVMRGYHEDEAGQILLNSFDELKHSLSSANPALSWQDCRTWLGMALESQHFTPSTNTSAVQLMTLEQSSHLHFDCLVIAAVEPQHYPGSANTSPFFNQAVRASLGLKTWEEQRRLRLELLNRALLCAPDILLTACNEENGEEKPVSPWLELLISFHDLARNNNAEKYSLIDNDLNDIINTSHEVFNCDTGELPEVTRAPSPRLPEELIPHRVSASAYQRLINCPYQFFAADGLRLKALEELRDELKKSDYGERIHLILQTFHSGHKKYGKAFALNIGSQTRHQAEKYLHEISEKVFLSDLENNVLHRSWLHRWLKHIPSYIDWQMQHQSEWQTSMSEAKMETVIADGHDASQLIPLTVYGRLDRTDQNRETGTHAIIDYKTGRTASQEEVDSGENVQLSTYALLDKQATNVSYLSVDSSSHKVESKSCLSNEELQHNREENRVRLIKLFRQMKNQQPLPAWGDDAVCSYCDFSGLCRKPEWAEN